MPEFFLNQSLLPPGHHSLLMKVGFQPSGYQLESDNPHLADLINWENNNLMLPKDSGNEVIILSYRLSRPGFHITIAHCQKHS